MDFFFLLLLRGVFPFFLSVMKSAACSRSKETTLERADFTLQLLMFVTAEKEGQMFIIFFFFSFFVSYCPHGFKLVQAECVQTMKAQTGRPRRQLFLM